MASRTAARLFGRKPLIMRVKASSSCSQDPLRCGPLKTVFSGMSLVVEESCSPELPPLIPKRQKQWAPSSTKPQPKNASLSSYDSLALSDFTSLNAISLNLRSGVENCPDVSQTFRFSFQGNSDADSTFTEAKGNMSVVSTADKSGDCLFSNADRLPAVFASRTTSAGPFSRQGSRDSRVSCIGERVRACLRMWPRS